MSMEMAGAIVQGLGLYFGAGVLFAIAFQILGLGRVDPAARGVGWGFRLLIFPALAALWPIMLVRWVRALFGGASA
ncbi:MAG: hypothetical protein AAGL49_05485 [Pseudomonadota bacterium]